MFAIVWIIVLETECKLIMLINYDNKVYAVVLN